jgi:hypothetical protein
MEQKMKPRRLTLSLLSGEGIDATEMIAWRTTLSEAGAEDVFREFALPSQSQIVYNC